MIFFTQTGCICNTHLVSILRSPLCRHFRVMISSVEVLWMGVAVDSKGVASDCVSAA